MYTPEPHFMSEPRRIYLAGPMSGIPQHNHPAFAFKASQLRSMGHFVFNPAEANPVDAAATYRHCMGVDLTWICNFAEAIVFLAGWQDSKGCAVEYALGRAIDIPMYRHNAGKTAEWVRV